MKIKAFFNSCDVCPTTIELKDNNNNIQTILWDDDIIMNENYFEINDAYFANEVSDDYDYETEYLYQNIISILDDFENNIDYFKILFSDEAGIVTALIELNEDINVKQTKLNAVWEKSFNANEKQDINIDNNKSDKNAEEYIDYYNQYITENGKTYLPAAKVDALSESLSSAEKLEMILQKRIEKKQTIEKCEEKEQTKIQVQSLQDDLEL